MEALYLLIPLSVVAVFGAAWVFFRMSDSGQFDDMEGPAWSVVHDDDRPPHAEDRAPGDENRLEDGADGATARADDPAVPSNAAREAGDAGLGNEPRLGPGHHQPGTARADVRRHGSPAHRTTRYDR